MTTPRFRRNLTLAFVAAGGMVCLGFGVPAAGASQAATAPEHPATAPATAPATQPATTDSDPLPPADELFRACVEAMGGEKAFNAIQSVRIKATLSSTLGESPIELISARPDKFFIRHSAPDKSETVVASDGAVGWMKSPDGDEYQLLDEAQTRLAQRRSPLYTIVLDLSKDHTDLRTIEQTEFNGHASYKVSMKDKNGLEQIVFFNGESKLVDGMIQTQPPPAGNMTATITFLEWKKYGDVTIFSKFSVDQAGMLTTMTFEDVEFDAVDPAIFNRPPEVERLVEEKEEEKADDESKREPTTRPTTQPE